MSTFDNQSMSIGCVGKLGHLSGFLRHYLLIGFFKTFFSSFSNIRQCVQCSRWRITFIWVVDINSNKEYTPHLSMSVCDEKFFVTMFMLFSFSLDSVPTWPCPVKYRKLPPTLPRKLWILTLSLGEYFVHLFCVHWENLKDLLLLAMNQYLCHRGFYRNL